jgi:hypothetical protein
MTGISERLAAASGAAGVVVLIVGGEIFNGDGPLARAGYALVVLSFVAFIVFLAFLHRILREAEGPGGWVATLALGAGLVYAAVRFAAQPPRMACCSACSSPPRRGCSSSTACSPGGSAGSASAPVSSPLPPAWSAWPTRPATSRSRSSRACSGSWSSASCSRSDRVAQWGRPVSVSGQVP